MRRFNTNDVGGELGYELRANFGEDVDMVELERSDFDINETDGPRDLDYRMFCPSCDINITPVMHDSWVSPECPWCCCIDLDDPR